MTFAPEAVPRARPPRRVYIDWARGIAVLLMIEAHTLDAWTRPADRHSALYQVATMFGGFAAPLFLWLAGVSVVLSATRRTERDGSRAAAIDASCRRGLEIVLLAFLFRLQAFVVSPGSHPITVFRVDILNVMGPAIVVAGLLWGVMRSTSGLVMVYAAAAAATAMVTPIVRISPDVDVLPTWVQWYLRPAGDYTTFTLLPWSGFVFAGAACGVLIAAVRDGSREWRLHTWLAAAALLLIGAGFYTATLPTIYRESSFWGSSPTFFAIRTGVVMIALSGVFAVARVATGLRATLQPLARIGQSSLFVYWIHVELVYGYASWLWRRRLPIWGSLVGWVAFSGLMYLAILWRDQLVARSARSTLQRKAIAVEWPA